MAGSRIAAEVVAFGSLVVLAHLVPPSEYGRATIALIVPTLASVLAFEACGSALVQRPSVETVHFRSAALLALGLGVALAGGTYLLAPMISDPLFGEQTTELVQLASPAFLISSFAAVPLARLQRKLDFRRISLIEVASLISAAVASAGLAVAGFDGEAIVLGALLGTVASTVALVLSAPPALPWGDRRALRDIAAFGLPASLQSLSWMGFRNVDYVIIGARAGAAQVGYYFRAFQFGVEYQGKVSTIIMHLAFPILSRTQDLDHMRSVHGRIVRTQVVLTFPFLISLAVLAPSLIPWLLGERWAPAVVPTQILVVAGMAFVLMATTSQLMLAAGHPRPLMVFNLASLLIYGTAIFLAAPHGLTVVCGAAAAAYVVMMLGNYEFLLRRFLGIPLRRLWEHVAPAAGASLALLAVEIPLSDLLTGAGAASPIVVVVTACAGISAYVAVLRLGFRDAWGDCSSLARGLLRRRRRGPAAVAREGVAG